MQIITIDLLLLFVTIFTSLILGLAVLLGAEREKRSINIVFFFVVISIILWTISNYAADITTDNFWILFFARSAYAMATATVGLFFYFSLIFPEGKKSNFKNIFAIFCVSAIFFIIAYTPLLINGVSLNLKTVKLVTGWAYIPFAAYFIVYLGAPFYLLIKKYRFSNGIEKQQIKYFFAGALLTSLSAFITNLIIPIITNSWSISHFGPYFAIFLVGFTTYAILKHHLFDIKVIATEVFSLVISFILFLKIFSSNGNQDLLFNIGIFFSVLLFGMFLVRAVIREVKHREEMEKMAEEIKKAYEVEKRANEELEALDNVKNQFLMTIQHHLRTPLTSMRGYADLLLDGTFGKMSKKVEDVVKRFEFSTNSMIKMVNDFLDITQFQLGKDVVSLKDGINLSPILEEIVKDEKLEADKRGIYLKLEKPDGSCLIKADESKLKAALVNIFDNSVKYTKEGGVTVKLKVENGKAKIEIKDTGIGIAKERLSKLFETTFERTAEAKKNFATGRGIGLYLSGKIIKAHNGKVWAESDGEGKGSVFFIELPKGS